MNKIEPFTYDILETVPVLAKEDKIKLIKISSPLETWFDDFKQGKSKNQNIIKPYKQWFFDNLENRINNLEKYIRTFVGFNNFQLDYSPKTLTELEVWLETSIKSEMMPEDEYTQLRNLFPMEIDIEKWTLTELSYSILYDVGMYFGEIMIHNYPNLKWTQYISTSKINVDVGHMVIQTKYKNCPMNPIWLVRIIGYKLIENKKEDRLLVRLFENNKDLF